jgi:hypothetical protein
MSERRLMGVVVGGLALVLVLVVWIMGVHKSSPSALSVANDYMHAEYVNGDCQRANGYFDTAGLTEPATPCGEHLSLDRKSDIREFIVRGAPHAKHACPTGYSTQPAQKCFEYTLVGHTNHLAIRGQKPVPAYTVKLQDVGLRSEAGRWKVVLEQFTAAGTYVAGSAGYGRARLLWALRVT